VASGSAFPAEALAPAGLPDVDVLTRLANEYFAALPDGGGILFPAPGSGGGRHHRAALGRKPGTPAGAARGDRSPGRQTRV